MTLERPYYFTNNQLFLSDRRESLAREHLKRLDIKDEAAGIFFNSGRGAVTVK